MTNNAASSELKQTFGSWNILHDGNHRLDPQHERIAGIAKVLLEWQPDVVGLYEVAGTDSNNKAGVIAERLGFDRYEFAANGDNNSGVMLAGREQVEGFETVVLDKEENRTALIAYCAGGLLVGAMHPSHYPVKGRRLRAQQTQELLNRMGDSERAVLMGDFNAEPRHSSRRMLEGNGFESVFPGNGSRHPRTFPSDPRVADVGRATPKWARPLVRGLLGVRALALDGVYVRGGHQVAEADTLPAGISRGEILSDHLGIAATIKWLNDPDN